MSSRITRDEHGRYRWSGTVDRGYEDKACKIVLGVCGGICAFWMAVGLFLGGEMLVPVFSSTAAAMAIAAGVCWLFKRNAGKRKQSYIMTEDSVQLYQRRYYAPFTFRGIKRAVVYESRDMIELFQAVGSAPVFTSHEDFPFVKDFILQRLPDTARVEYW
ncbi:MAG: hypothetical protein IK099_06215 [Clostridia bacterium]|nr:hypothetical protein [Clostridia bacterium]